MSLTFENYNLEETFNEYIIYTLYRDKFKNKNVNLFHIFK